MAERSRRAAHGMRSRRPRPRTSAVHARGIAEARALTTPRLEEATDPCAHRHILTEEDDTRWCGLCGAALEEVPHA